MKKLLLLIGIVSLIACQKQDEDGLELLAELEAVEAQAQKNEALKATHFLINEAIDKMFEIRGFERMSGKTDFAEFQNLELIIDVFQNMAAEHPEFFQQGHGPWSQAFWMFQLNTFNAHDDLDRDSDEWKNQAHQEAFGYKWGFNKMMLEIMDEWIVKNIDADGIDSLIVEPELVYSGNLIVNNKEVFRGSLTSYTITDNNGGYVMTYEGGQGVFLVRYSPNSGILDYVLRPEGKVDHQISYNFKGSYEINNETEDVSSATINDATAEVWVYEGEWDVEQFEEVTINAYYQFSSEWNFNQN